MVVSFCVYTAAVCVVAYVRTYSICGWRAENKRTPVEDEVESRLAPSGEGYTVKEGRARGYFYVLPRLRKVSTPLIPQGRPTDHGI